jgi:two-component system, cell cycle sensor histidine kinase and response regulator CckA
MTTLDIQNLLDRQIAVNRLALAIGDTRDLKRVYHTIYEHVNTLMDITAFIVSIYDGEKQEIRAGYVISHDQEIVDVSGFPPLPLGEPESGTQSRVIHSGESLYVPDWRKTMEEDANIEYKVAANGAVTEGPPPPDDLDITRSGILVPMKVEGKVIGVLQVQSHRLDAYTQEDVDLLAALGNVAAVAIRNSQLYNQLQQELAERQRAETALRQSEARYRMLFNSAADSIFIHNLEGTILEVNQMACERLGYSREELLEMSPSDLNAPEYTEELKLHLKQIEQRGYMLIESAHVRKDGTTFPVELSTRLIQYNDQPALLTVARDVTERQQIEQQLRQQERLAAVGQLAGGIAHDFNNLLTTIILYAQLALSKPGLSPDVSHALSVIQGESQKAADLVQQILDFSRRAMMERQPINLKPFIKELSQMLARTLPETIDLRLDIEDEEDYLVEADLTRIQQALMNLVLNARDAMPKGGEARIELAQQTFDAETPAPVLDMQAEHWIRLTVADTGTGIPDDVLPHLFEPFYTTKERGKGTGLGLAQVYGIIKQHEGYIDVQTQVHEGSAFHIYLPEHRGAQAEPEPATSTEHALPLGHDERLLIVEDEAGVRQAIKEILEPLHYRVETTNNGRAALAAYYDADGDFDLVITDLVMPEMDGVSLISNLREIAPGLKTMAITGYAGVEDLEQLRATQIWDAVLQKPFEARVLAEKVRAVLDGE